LKANTSGSDNVKITPQNVVGCDEGGDYCLYTITGTSVTGNSYTGGALPSFTVSGKSDGATETYEVSLTNSAGTTKKECSVEFTAGPTCNCTCGDCSNVRTTTYSQNQNGPGMYCFFMDDENVKLRMDSYTREDAGSNNKPHCSVTINGTSLAKFGATELKNLVSTKIDGGYYIYVGNDASAVQNTDFCSFYFETTHTSSTNPCGSGSGGSGGSGDDGPTLTTTFKSYSTGTYTLTTGTVGSGYPDVMHCKSAAVDYDRTIGTVNSNCTIVIPANNTRSNGKGCSVSSNGTYTFVVGSGVPSDLTCGLEY
jgi:hypothetical protein